LILLVLLVLCAARAETSDWLASGPGPAAALLLESAPHTLSRPSTTSTFSTSLNTLATSTSIPENWAMEVAPYWLFSHPRLSLDRYLRGGPRVLVDNLSVSVATTTDDDGPIEAGAGFNTALRWGDRARLRMAVDTCTSSLQRRLQDKATYVGDRIAWAVAASEDPVKARDTAEKDWDKENASYKAETEKKQAECRSLVSKRRGFAVDLGGGLAAWVPDMDASQASFSRAGAWLTPAWLADHGAVSGIVGFLATRPEDGAWVPFVRTGVQVAKAWEKGAIAPEGILDIRPGAGPQGRVGVGIDVQAAPGLWVSTHLSLGLPLDEPGSLGAHLGFTWGTGALRKYGEEIAPPVPGAA